MSQVLFPFAKYVGLRPVLWSLVVVLVVCAQESYGDSSQQETKPNDTTSQRTAEPDQQPELQELNVLFDFRPSVRAIGFLVAQKEGYYAAAKLPPVVFSWKHNGLTWNDSASGKVQFIVSSFPQAVEVSSKTNRATIISQLITKSSLGLVFRTDCLSNVNRIDDFQDMRIGIAQEDMGLAQSYLRYYGVKFVCISLAGSGHELLIPGGLGAICLHSYQLPELTEYGRRRTLHKFFTLADSEIIMPEDCLCCDRDFVKANRALCRDFVLALWQGWRLTAAKPEKALNLWKAYCQENHIVLDERVARMELKRYVSLLQFHSQLDKSGNLSPESYEQATMLLIRAGIITKEHVPEYGAMFDPVLSSDVSAETKTGYNSPLNQKEVKRVP